MLKNTKSQWFDTFDGLSAGRLTVDPKKLIIIVGPTSSGKSDLGVRIALRLSSGQARKKYGIGGAEIISADSRQVYRGMDIGTGKITKKEMRGVPHYLLDVASPRAVFNVSDFKILATKTINEISDRGRVPILVGGTGFWIDALIYDWPLPEVGPNLKLRSRLEKLTVEKLYAKLKKLDPMRARNIDRHNKRRLIRALEIIMVTGKTMPEFNISYENSKLSKIRKIGAKEYQILMLGIKIQQKELADRIFQRLIERLKGGMINEIKKLHRAGVSWKRLDGFGLEYRYVSRYLRGLSPKTSSRDRLAYDQMVEELYLAIKNYAKRQMRWFKRNPQIKWICEPNQASKFADKFIV